MRDAVIVAEAGAGQIVLWNAAAERALGYSQDEALGMSLERLVPDQLRNRHRVGIHRYADTGHGELVESGQVVELPALRRNGEQIWVELTLTPLDAARVPGRYVLAIVRDVTERRRLEEAFRQRLAVEAETIEALRELHELKDTFLQTAAHDLRSPLSTIHGFAEVLSAGWEEFEPARRQEMLQTLLGSTERLQRLVDDFLASAALEAGTLPISIQPLDLPPLIERTAAEIGERQGTSVVQVEMEADLPSAAGDPERVWQVLANLLSNAMRYSSPGHPVRISARGVEDAVEVSVSDEGPGIAPEDLPRIFDKFARGRREAAQSGTGLGLYIARCLIEGMGGMIWAEPAPEGGGATVVFRLPQAH